MYISNRTGQGHLYSLVQTDMKKWDSTKLPIPQRKISVKSPLPPPPHAVAEPESKQEGSSGDKKLRSFTSP
jgi:hypothetical protein